MASLSLRLAAVVAATAAAVLISLPPGNAADVHSPEWEAGRGGRLYDRWYEETMALPPAGPHPLYPANGTANDAETWRCVTCHGWDYRGMALLPGTDLRHLQGAVPKRVVDVLATARHGFAGLFSPIAIDRLAAFLTEGQIVPAVAIDPATGRAEGGDWVRGAWLFATVCGACHGNDGTRLALPSGGTLAGTARSDPWRFMHKVRFGEPDTGMAALMLLSAEDQANILVFAQRLNAP